MPDFTAQVHPVLAVRCPSCGKAAGVWCIRSSGHRAGDLHAARCADADLAFIDEHGQDASIESMADGWRIDPAGRSAAGVADQMPLPL